MKYKGIIFFVLIITIILICVLLGVYTNNTGEIATIYAVVIKVNEEYLDVMLLNQNYSETYVDLCMVPFANEGNIGFYMGQEILIYSNGIMTQSYPGGISRG